MPDESMEDLDQPATRRDLQEFATRRDFEEFATRRDLEEFATRHDFAALEARLDARFDELHRHFDVSVEAFRADIRNIIDFTTATTTSLSGRVETLENNHGRRLTSLELRTTRLERRKK
jgi:hypothetical protein